MAEDNKNGEKFTVTPQPNEEGTKQKQSKSKASKSLKVVNIEPDKLEPFKGHPFNLYEGKRLEDLVNSIKEMGVMQPISVRPIGDEKYQILAGHNRVNAAREAGLKAIPAIIHEDLSDEDAKIIVVESNFNQRSSSEMKPSELANSLFMLNKAMKKKSGTRSDLIESEDGSQPENRSRTMHQIGKKHNLSQATIARYIRLSYLMKELQERLDNKQIGMGAAVHLSYLEKAEQKIIEALFKEDEALKIGTEQAEKLHKESESLKEGSLNKEAIRQILESKSSPVRKRSIKFSEELFSRYFNEDQDPEEIEDTIAKALELYAKQNKG